jgi:hypothetical protein
LQAYFVAHGAGVTAAHTAALQEIARFVQGEGFILAMQDAFRFTLITVVLALIAVFFVRNKSKSKARPAAPPRGTSAGPDDAGEMAAAEAMMAG